MKNLDKFVREEVSEDEKIEIVKNYYSYLMREEIMDILVLLDSAIRKSKIFNQDAIYTEILEDYKKVYITKKENLEKIDLWNEKFDKVYEQTIKGKLNMDELLNIE